MIFPQIDETLLGMGVDPWHTPVDRLPADAQAALAYMFGFEYDTVFPWSDNA